MKLSIAFFAAVSAVPSDFPLPDECNVLAGAFGDDFPGLVNCWFAYPNPSDFLNDTIPVEPSTGYGNCGFQWKGGSMTNSTCTGFEFTTVNDASLMIGNAAFVAKGYNKNQIVGLDMSGDLNIIQSWEVNQFDADTINDEEKAFYDAKTAALEEQINITGTDLDGDFDFVGKSFEGCKVGDITFTPPKCVYDADGYYTDYAIMITNQHAGDANNNYAIANYGGKGSQFTVNFPNQACDKYGFSLHDENQAELQVLKADSDCTLLISVDKGQAQLLYFQGSLNEGVVDFFDGVNIELA